MNKSKLAFLAVTVGTLALTACGGGNQTSSSARQRPSIMSIEESSVSLEPLPDPKVKINGGEAVTVARGSAIEKPADPVAPEGKIFYGWKNVKNGGQIWDFDTEYLNKVMDDVELEPLFIEEHQVQLLEPELCPSITEDNDGEGMKGNTYSGGNQGKGLIYKDVDKQYNVTTISHVDYYKTSFAPIELDDPDAALYDDKVQKSRDFDYGAFVHFLYVNGSTLTFEVEVSEAATNVPLFGHYSAEYGLTNPRTNEITDTFNDQEFTVKVNGTRLEYGEICIRNVIYMSYIPFQDYYIGSVNLNKGKNIIEFKVDNTRILNGTIQSSAPCFDSVKLFTSSTVTMTNAKGTNLIDDNNQ